VGPACGCLLYQVHGAGTARLLVACNRWAGGGGSRGRLRRLLDSTASAWKQSRSPARTPLRVGVPDGCFRQQEGRGGTRVVGPSAAEARRGLVSPAWPTPPPAAHRAGSPGWPMRMPAPDSTGRTAGRTAGRVRGRRNMRSGPLRSMTPQRHVEGHKARLHKMGGAVSEGVSPPDSLSLVEEPGGGSLPRPAPARVPRQQSNRYRQPAVVCSTARATLEQPVPTRLEKAS